MREAFVLRSVLPGKIVLLLVELRLKLAAIVANAKVLPNEQFLIQMTGGGRKLEFNMLLAYLPTRCSRPFTS